MVFMEWGWWAAGMPSLTSVHMLFNPSSLLLHLPNIIHFCTLGLGLLRSDCVKTQLLYTDINCAESHLSPTTLEQCEKSNRGIRMVLWTQILHQW